MLLPPVPCGRFDKPTALTAFALQTAGDDFPAEHDPVGWVLEAQKGPDKSQRALWLV